MSYRTIISAKHKIFLIDWQELLNYKELFYIFAWRDIKVRYKQTALGIIWVIFQPLISTFIFTIFFGNFAKIPSDKLPYPLFVLIGLVFWSFFSNIITHSTESLVANETIIKKVYFPKILLPLSTILSASVDFAINLILLGLISIFFQKLPSISLILILPISALITAITAIGLGLFLSSLNVKYRDVRYILPFFTQILLFLTPVIYPISIISPQNRLIMALNPMTSVVQSVRFAYNGVVIPDLAFIMLISLLSSFFLFLFGVWYFIRTERFFADIV